MRGGKRKGAGRKPRSSPAKTITVKLDAQDVERFKSICKSNGLSQAKQIKAWIKHKKSRPGKIIKTWTAFHADNSTMKTSTR